MANTIDNFTLKITAEGTAQVKQAATEIKNLDAAAQASQKNLNNAAGGIRNIGYQVQDFTVQVSNGTSAITALSQQLPQLLSNFGTIGVYLGIAAAAIPLVVAGFRLFGGDARDLNDRIKDLSESTKSFQDAQKANMPTLQGLGNEFGSLTAVAKEFFQVQQDLMKMKAEFELTGALNKLKTEFSIFSPDVKKLEEDLGKIGAGYVIPNLDGIGTALKRMNLGLSAEQAKTVADQIKSIDPKNAEQTAETFKNILVYLKETGADTDKFLKFWNEVVSPIIQVNNQILELNRNVKESAENASRFNVEMLNLQTSMLPKIGEAKRNFDQIRAVRLESELKFQTEKRKLEEQSAKDGVDRTEEIAALDRNTRAQILEREKDIGKQQWETFRAAYLTADAKIRQLDLEGNIIDIQEQGRYNLQYETQLEVDRLRVLRDYESTMLNIAEMRRKNTISEEKGRALEREAEMARDKGYQNAEANRQRRINDAKDAQTAALFDLKIKGIGIENERELLQLRQSMRDGYPEDVDSMVRVVQLKQQQSDYERRLLEDVRLGKITQADAADRIAQANSNLQESIRLEKERNAEASRYRTLTFDEGIAETLKKMASEIPTPMQAAERSVRAVFDGMTNALDSFVRTGKLNFKQLAMSIIADILRIQLQANMSAIFKSDQTGGFLSSLFKFFPKGGSAGNISYAESPLGFSIPAFAQGGIVNKPTIGLIGEAGPEAVVPLSRMSAPVVNYNIQAVDASSFRALVARDPEFIYNITEQGRRNTPSRRLA